MFSRMDYQKDRGKRGVMARKELLMAFIIAYKKKHDGNSPTYREMMAGTGLSTTSSVAYHLEKLEAEGRIERPLQVGNTRVIEVVGGEWSWNEKEATLCGDRGNEGW